MSEDLKPKPEPTPTQRVVIGAYLQFADSENPFEQEKADIFKVYLDDQGVDPGNFQSLDLQSLTDEQKIQAIKEKYDMLRNRIANPEYRKKLDEQEQQELAPFLRLDDKA